MFPVIIVEKLTRNCENVQILVKKWQLFGIFDQSDLKFWLFKIISSAAPNYVGSGPKLQEIIHNVSGLDRAATGQDLWMHDPLFLI